MSAIIKCEDVSIRYITGDFKDIGIKEYLIRRLTHNYHVTEFWADRHVTFELEPGDMLGIIGSNGAGKSTLLKAISGIMAPTEGWVECNGKISALLELGSGFDGDLTVRENTYLRAAMLGYSRDFVESMYDSIIDFAELQDFQERPFKQLSSGMKSRLAFSIASLVKPEILILDEVLSVGDGAFRKKSEAKMREIINGGATTILVSHSLGQVRSMSNKILWLDHGRQVAFGSNVKGLCDAYQKYLDTKVMPAPEDLPPLDIDVPSPKPAEGKRKEKASDAPGSEGQDVIDLGGAPQKADAGSVSAKKARAPFAQRLRSMPRALKITFIAVLLITAVIAVSEARLPAKVQALPQTAQRVLYSDDATSVGVYLWESKLYVFVPREMVEQSGGDMTFYLGVVDSHGYRMSDTFDVNKLANGRFSTDSTEVLVIPMGRYPGYTHVVFGQLADGASADQVNEDNMGQLLVWGGIYDKAANTGRIIG